MLRSVQGLTRSLPVGGAMRAIHTTAVVPARKRNNRKAELEAKRKAEAEAAQRAQEQLRKLKDTAFLNSLVNAGRLFDTTQISQQDAALHSTRGQQQESEGATKRQASSGLFSCQVSNEEINLVTKVAPKAILGGSAGYSSHVMPELAMKNAEIQADIVRRIVALENANSKAVVKFNVQKALGAVQAAVAHRKDHHNRRAYTHLLHKRAKILKYLKRESLERYYLCLKQLGLTKEMVEGEIVSPKRIE
ncbi:hypothetical protein DL89DRAFT_289370 [Linderina pennispora]|uniref:S15/NS1 RNA-binding domain-containing protein n=1 Tax=Linderina pennispora TaxID=61395 RepID=A0A1Y1WJF6_9FUNG|nr:uncharacterized protein DL89DRAFT_289370 [Linderina pennispora]ORX73623.1 hypothetical protein DL89DRAFT_289370 [Linderina pennispora]